MELIINKNEKRFEFFQDETISGVVFAIDTDEAAFKVTDLANILVTVYTAKDGKKQVQMIPEKTKLSDLINVNYANEVLLIDDMVAEKLFPIYFKTPFNLFKGVQLFIEVSNGGSVTTPAATMTITAETIPAVGVNEFIPVMDKIELESTRTEFDLDLGSDVYGVVDVTNPSQLTNVRLKSDKLTMDVSPNVLKLQKFDAKEYDGGFTKPKYLVRSHLPLNNCRLKLTYSVGAARTLYVLRRKITPEIVTNFMVKQAEHTEENAKAIKMAGSKETCDCD